MSLFNFYLNKALKHALTTTKRDFLFYSAVKYLESFALSHNFTSRPNQKFFDTAYKSIESSGLGISKVSALKRILKLLDLTAQTCCINPYNKMFITPIPLPSIDDASKVVARFCFPITSNCPLPHLIRATINSLEQQSSLAYNSICCLKAAIMDLYLYAIHDMHYTYSLDLIEFWNNKSLLNFERGKISHRIKKFQDRASMIIVSFARTGYYSCDYRFGIIPEMMRNTAFYTAVQEALNQIKPVYESSVFIQIKCISNKLIRFASVNKFDSLTKEALTRFIDEEFFLYQKDSSYYDRSLVILRQLDRTFSLNIRNPHTGLLLNEITIDDEKAAIVEGLSLQMKEKCTIDAVISQAKVVIQKTGISASTIGQYVRAWRILIGFVVCKYGNIHCQAAVDEFLVSVEKDYSAGKLNEWKRKQYRRAASVLKEVAQSGAFTWKAFQFVRSQLTDEQEEIKNHLEQDLRLKNLSEARIGFYCYVLRSFFLCTGIKTKQELANMEERTVIKISKYFKDHCCKNSLSTIVPTLRGCLEWFFNAGYVSFDFSRLVLSIQYVDCHVVPYLSEDDEIKVRKYLPEMNVRNRAMFLLAMDLGLRNSDIVNLRLSNIDWKHDRINIIQHKTGVPASYPLLEEIGNALFFYITQMRPDDAEADYVFVRIQAPHTRLNSTYNFISKIFNSLEISPQNGHGKGAHTLRYTLTHRLLSKGEIPHQTITGVLGHKTNSTDKSYRSMEDSKLMECTLDLSEIGCYEMEE